MFNFNPLKPGNVLLPNLEHRVFLGTGVFVGIVLLVGWIALNEPARMQVFTQTYHARSVENGATIFINYCATCHGIDAKGQTGVAPALDNPMLFLSENPAVAANNKVNDLKGQSDTLTQNIADLKQLAADQTQYDAMSAADKNADAGTKLKADIDKLTKSTKGLNLADVQKQLDDTTPKLADAQKTLADLTAKGWDPNRDVRIKELGWPGSLHDFIYSTIFSGRPVSAAYWPKPMPTWSNQAGGQLRPDEIEDVTQYILNFQDQAVNLTPKDVNQQFIKPTKPGANAVATQPPVGAAFANNTDGQKKLAASIVSGALKGDPAHGQQLYTDNGCAGCHSAPGGAKPTCPPLTGTYTRISTDRMPLGKWDSPEQYIIESIVSPGAYVVSGYADGVMPSTFPTKLSQQDLADLVDYLQTQK
jgi:mono/diheme cytochrome c family protein